MTPEGLAAQPLSHIITMVTSIGANCIRLTFASEMVYDMEVNRTTEDGFQKVELPETYSTLVSKNPWVRDQSRLDVFEYVIEAFGKAGIMVIVDNHVSKAKWCCSENDGNGWFRDEHFDTDLWKQSHLYLATRLKTSPFVIGVGLRNELRGSRQNVDEYAELMYGLGEEILKIQPNWILFMGGIQYATDLTVTRSRPPPESLRRNLVWEAHWYAWSHFRSFRCDEIRRILERTALFVLEPGQPFSAPLFLGEWGTNMDDISDGDVDGTNPSYLVCVVHRILPSYPQLHWSIWSIQGSYYSREGHANSDEPFGVLTSDWSSLRNSRFQTILSNLLRIYE